MVSRRRFLLVLGGATAGLWLAGTGLISGPRVFICDACIADAAGTVTAVIRA